MGKKGRNKKTKRERKEQQKKGKKERKRVIILNKQQIWQQIFHLIWDTNAYKEQKLSSLHLQVHKPGIFLKVVQN